MRWLMIALLVSLMVLLFAAAALVHHVWRQRKKFEQETPAAQNPARKTGPGTGP